MSNASTESHSKRRYDAADTVKLVQEAPLDLVYTTTFSDKNHVPSLIDLAIAADVAHTEDQQYSLLEHQCYWWADTLMAILESLVEEKYRTKDIYSSERSGDNEWTPAAGKYQFWHARWAVVSVHNRAQRNFKSLFMGSNSYDVIRFTLCSAAAATNFILRPN